MSVYASWQLGELYSISCASMCRHGPTTVSEMGEREREGELGFEGERWGGGERDGGREIK